MTHTPTQAEIEGLIASYAAANINWARDPKTYIEVLHNAHAALLAAFAALQPANCQAYLTGHRDMRPEWQPIETAPKDGNDILLFFPGKLEVACWNDEARPRESGLYPWLTGTGLAYHEKAFSYWMPLPDAPETKGGEDAPIADDEVT